LAGPEKEHDRQEEPEQWPMLSKLKASAGGVRGELCPDEEVWLQVAAGIPTLFSDAPTLMAHAIDCDYCASLLFKAAENLSADPTEEEEKAIDSISLERPRQIYAEEAAKLKTSKVVAFPSPSRSRMWAYAAAALIALLPVTWWAVSKARSEDPSTLLASAYTQNRTLELRFPGAAYGPLRQRRGGAIDPTGQPAARTQALLLIQQQLSANPDRADALIAKGRLALLDWNYKDAIQSFTRAQELQPGSPALPADLASAYFERASVENSALDFGRAFEYIEKALAVNPKDPVALYNRARIAEHMQTYQEAIMSWRKYLEVEPNGDWSTEARQRLLDLEQKKKRLD
jgi:tetratricopeptide (TPR) repeat protein